MENLKICTEALKTWGAEKQTMMMIEEMGELMSALSKYKRGRVYKSAVVEEIADVDIMLTQMALLFGLDDFIAEREFKLKRLKERLESTSSNV